ncbi:MAG: hypothetical protein ACK48X_12350, partial [Planctomycetota bacterium]
VIRRLCPSPPAWHLFELRENVLYRFPFHPTRRVHRCIWVVDIALPNIELSGVFPIRIGYTNIKKVAQVCD